MKKVVLSLAIVLVGLNVLAQQEGLKSQKMNEAKESINIERLNKMEQSSWFSYVDGARENGGISWVRITNATLFPDTLVYQAYSDVLGKTQNFSVGEVFDPKDDNMFIDEPSALSNFNEYTLDSVFIRFRYAHNVPGSVDTLLVQFINNDGINRYTFTQSQRITAAVGYDPVNNRPLKPTSEVRILLNAEDTTDWAESGDYQGQVIAVPDGMKVDAGGLCAVTMTYLPGFAYSEGDTIEFDWESPKVTNKLNHFICPMWWDREKVAASFPSYNNGLKVTTGNRYTADNWDDLYVPGNAWNDFDEHQYIFFHATTQNLSIDEIKKHVKLYPNPASNGNVYIELDDQVKSIQLVDLTGKVLRTESIVGSQQLKISNLSQGVYLLKLNINDKTYTQKLVVK